VAGGLSDDLVRAIGRQIAQARAVTDGESPYYAGNEWHADLWRIDNELIVADYLRRYTAEWSVRPSPDEKCACGYPLNDLGLCPSCECPPDDND
jgi:hypothetical protein